MRSRGIGCAISHLKCWELAVARGDRRFLVLEDDVLFVDGFVERLQNGLTRVERFDANWDLVYLGRVPLEPGRRVIDGIVQPVGRIRGVTGRPRRGARVCHRRVDWEFLSPGCSMLHCAAYW
jgi:hypothetical protein